MKAFVLGPSHATCFAACFIALQKSMRLEDMNEQETRELTEQVNALHLENKSLASKLKNQIEYGECKGRRKE